MNITNELLNADTKRYIVEHLSPFYTPEELEGLFSIKAESVRYYANRYGIPTAHQYKKTLRREVEETVRNNLARDRIHTLARIKEELDIK